MACLFCLCVWESEREGSVCSLRLCVSVWEMERWLFLCGSGVLSSRHSAQWHHHWLRFHTHNSATIVASPLNIIVQTFTRLARKTISLIILLKHGQFWNQTYLMALWKRRTSPVNINVLPQWTCHFWGSIFHSEFRHYNVCMWVLQYFSGTYIQLFRTHLTCWSGSLPRLLLSRVQITYTAGARMKVIIRKVTQKTRRFNWRMLTLISTSRRFQINRLLRNLPTAVISLKSNY